MSDKAITGVKIWIDRSFLQTKGAGELLTSLEKSNIQPIIEKLPVENAIFWTRKATNSKDCNQETQHDHLLVKLELDTLIEYLHSKNSNDLILFVKNSKKNAQVSQMTLIVPGFKNFQKSLKNNNDSKKKISKYDLNQTILKLSLDEKCCLRSFESSEELRDLVMGYTKSIGEYLSKTEGVDNLMFSAASVEKSQTKVSKEGQGLINLWKDILEGFPLVSSDQAQAICSQHPSPLLLYNKYMQSNTAPMLLADIQVRRGAGVLSSVRRIGPELSQKVHKFFTSVKPDELIVND